MLSETDDGRAKRAALLEAFDWWGIGHGRHSLEKRKMAKFYTFDEEFSLQGEWSVPSDPAIESRQGILTFEPGKYTSLGISGSGLFPTLSAQKTHTIGMFSERGHMVIKGTVESGHTVLLLESQTIGFNVFYPRFVLVSDQDMSWNAAGEVEFRRLAARYTYLEEWRNVFPFEDRKEFDEQNELRRYSVEYIAPEPIVVPVNTINAEIRFAPNFVGTHNMSEATIRYRVINEISANEKQPLEWLVHQLQHVQDLLALLTGQQIRKLELVAKLNKSETDSGLGQMIHIFHSVPMPSPERRGGLHSMLSATDLDQDLPNIVKAWFEPEVYELWEVQRDIYFGVLYEAIGVPRFRFLALTQALESYHRKKSGGEYVSKEDFAPIKQALINAIPYSVKRDHRDSLKSRINYGYQYSQRKRFEELLAEIGGKFQKLIGIEEADSNYIARIFATRNFYTHYDTDDRSLIFNERELDQAIRRLAHLVLVLILNKELGLSEQKTEKLLTKRKDHGQLW